MKHGHIVKYTYTAPAYWASYLINGDASGMDDDEAAQCDAWIDSLGYGAPVDCSDEGEFAHSNDATDLGGAVCTYTFLAPHATKYRYLYVIQARFEYGWEDIDETEDGGNARYLIGEYRVAFGGGNRHTPPLRTVRRRELREEAAE